MIERMILWFESHMELAFIVTGITILIFAVPLGILCEWIFRKENEKKDKEAITVKHYCDTDAKCPFYQCEERQEIFCEGVEPRTRLHLAFAAVDQKQAYKLRCCRGEYGGCMIARMLTRKYNE